MVGGSLEKVLGGGPVKRPHRHPRTLKGGPGMILKVNTKVALRIKLRLGLKLCKLPGRFWASVNKVNYSVNYNFCQVTCRTTSVFSRLKPN